MIFYGDTLRLDSRFVFLLIAAAILAVMPVKADVILVQYNGGFTYTDLDGSRMESNGLLDGPAGAGTSFHFFQTGNFGSPADASSIISFTPVPDPPTTSRPFLTIESNFGGPFDIGPDTCGGSFANCTPATAGVIYDAFQVTWSTGGIDKVEFEWMPAVPEPSSIILLSTILLGFTFVMRKRIPRT